MAPDLSLLAEHSEPASDDDACPEYNVAISRSNTSTTSSSVHWSSAFDDPSARLGSVSSPGVASISAHSSSRSRRSPRSRPERYLYTYNLVAGSAPCQFLISVEPASGKPTPGKYTFRLSIKVHDVERPLGESIYLRLSVDPRSLDFAVFVFPGKTSIPSGCLYSLRVWLRVNGIDHRLFGEDELWIGKDPDFTSIGDASFARIRSVSPTTQVYDAFVGGARIQFFVRWKMISERLYKYTLDYEASGVGGTLIDDFRLILDGDPRKVTFLIYSVPMNSVPVNASHRLRVWLRSLVPISRIDSTSNAYALPFKDSYIYQRIWKSDNFKIGSRLDFGSLGSKMVMGFSAGEPQTIVMASPQVEVPAAYSDEKVL